MESLDERQFMLDNHKRSGFLGTAWLRFCMFVYTYRRGFRLLFIFTVASGIWLYNTHLSPSGHNNQAVALLDKGNMTNQLQSLTRP